MFIEMRDDVENNRMVFTITVPREHIVGKCQAHPAAHLITPEQGAGIIEDAILLAMGLELKKE